MLFFRKRRVNSLLDTIRRLQFSLGINLAILSFFSGCYFNVEIKKNSSSSLSTNAIEPSSLCPITFKTNINCYLTISGSEYIVKKKQEIIDDNFLSDQNNVIILKQSDIFKLYNTISEYFKMVKVFKSSAGFNISDDLKSRMAALNLEPFLLKQNNVFYFGLEEKKPHKHGYGFLLVRFDYNYNAKKILIEIPHPLFDSNTPELGSELFFEARPTAYIQTGAHRNTNTMLSSSAYPGNYSTSTTYQITDVAHSEPNFFTMAHIVLSEDATYVIQLHGFGASGEPSLYSANPPIEAVLSGGTKSLRPTLLPTLKSEFANLGVHTGIFPEDVSALGAQANIQGAHIRSALGLKFYHIESRTELRASATERSKIVKAIRKTFGL